MQLQLIRGQQGRVVVEKRDGAALLATHAGTFVDDSHYKKASAVLSVNKDRLMQIVDAFKKATDERQTVELDKPAPFTCVVRGRLETAETGQPHSDDNAIVAFKAALDRQDLTMPEPLISWTDTDQLAALDLDYHHILYPNRKSEQALLLFAEQIKPRPFMAWATHGKGLRLMYVAAGVHAADELAAAAAMSAVSIDPNVTVEIKSITRHPRYAIGDRTAGTIIPMTPTTEMDALTAFMGRKTLEDGAVEEYLEDRGLTIGRRYDHSHCPLNPAHPSHNEPVQVFEDGIHCHSCQKTVKFDSLIGSCLPGQVTTCLNNFTHWAHAKHVIIAALHLPESVARLAYGAALKMCHGPDPRISRVFKAGEDFLRYESRWGNAAGETYTSPVIFLLESLPACQYVAADGEVKVNHPRRNLLEQPTDLTQWGYPAITPIWGMKIYGHRLTYRSASRIPIVVQQKRFTDANSLECFTPRYIPAAERWNVERAWGVLERVFPGLHRAAVQLLVAAKGCAEGQVGLPPMLWISGPSGSGKTGILSIAAAMTGDGTHSVTWSPGDERLRQGILSAKEHCSYAVFNEIAKDSNKGKHGIKPDEAVQFLLNLTPDSVSHKLYVGPVPLGVLPVLCLTDTKLPTAIIHNTQLARRITHVKLDSRLAWEDTIKNSGIGAPGDIRFAGPDYATACNVIVSDLIDRYFTIPWTFGEIATDLGFGTLEKHESVEEKLDNLRNLFRAVCEAPAIPEGSPHYRRWHSRGWKLIETGDRTDLLEAWERVCDGGWTSSERCSETDWAALVSVPVGTQFDISNAAKNRIAVRFRWTPNGNRNNFKTNEELLNGTVELEAGPVQGSDNRPGDAEHPRSEKDYEPRVYSGLYDPPPEPGS